MLHAGDRPVGAQPFNVRWCITEDIFKHLAFVLPDKRGRAKHGRVAVRRSVRPNTGLAQMLGRFQVRTWRGGPVGVRPFCSRVALAQARSAAGPPSLA